MIMMLMTMIMSMAIKMIVMVVKMIIIAPLPLANVYRYQRILHLRILSCHVLTSLLSDFRMAVEWYSCKL